MTERRWAVLSRKVIGVQNNPMLIRWRLIQTPWFGVYLHFIHREDLDRLPHDHPWTFWTYVLRGGYVEELHDDIRLIGQVPSNVQRTWRAGFTRRWHRFPQNAAHRITQTIGKTTTLVIVGPKNRTWGFYDGAGNFIDWREYHKVTGGQAW